MAVVMTTKFYEEDTPAWHDLSKVVFTSPNMDSPNAAGTRSHILPGKGDLALWYEDTANMYEIEPIQDTYDTSFYYYSFDVVNDIDLDGDPTSALVTSGNYSDFINFINRELNVEIVGFVSVNEDIFDETVRLEYKLKAIAGYEVENIYLCTKSTHCYGGTCTYTSHGWMVSVMPEIPECYIDFEFIEASNITYMSMEPLCVTSVTDGEADRVYYYIGNFKIQGKTTMEGASWVDLYTGANADIVTIEIFMTSNTEYYTYYRILILNNDCISGDCASSFYGLSCLSFYGYGYSDEPGTGHIILYSFDEDDSSRKLHVVNAVPVTGSGTNTEYNTNTDVEGVINVSNFLNGEELTTKYIVNVDNGEEPAGYETQASGNSVSPVVSGTTGTEGTTGITSISQDFGVLNNGYVDVVGETKIENGCIYSILTGSQENITYSNYMHDITTDITYTTAVSGTIVSGTVGDVAVTGYTNRYEDRDSAPRSSFYDLSLSDTVGSGIISAGTSLSLWQQKTDLEGVYFSAHDSIVFEITQGEAYDCRLTAWDDVTHSTTLNYLIMGNYVRVSALAFRAEGTILAPEISTTPDNYIASPIYNRIFKGNTVYEGTNYYYGDFDLSARTESNMIGDYLIFKPMLYDVDETIPYGIHDHVIVLHYSYT